LTLPSRLDRLLNFRQLLTSNLHFRQYKLPENMGVAVWDVSNPWVSQDSGQAIASHRGKEMRQVTNYTPAAFVFCQAVFVITRTLKPLAGKLRQL